MKLKFTVVSRLEGLNKEGVIQCGVVMVSTDTIPAKLEIGNLTQEQTKNFLPGRVVSITIPTYIPVVAGKEPEPEPEAVSETNVQTAN